MADVEGWEEGYILNLTGTPSDLFVDKIKINRCIMNKCVSNLIYRSTSVKLNFIQNSIIAVYQFYVNLLQGVQEKVSFICEEETME